MKRRKWVATQMRATLANGGPITGATITAWAKELDKSGPYSNSDGKYNNETYVRSAVKS